MQLEIFLSLLILTRLYYIIDRPHSGNAWTINIVLEFLGLLVESRVRYCLSWGRCSPILAVLPTVVWPQGSKNGVKTLWWTKPELSLAGVLADPEFGSSVNPIPIRGGQIMPTTLHTDSVPRFENLTTALQKDGKNSKVTSKELNQYFLNSNLILQGVYKSSN